MSIATFLFTDIADSTEHVLRLGDARWDLLLASYRATVRRELHHFGGREVDAAGDGFFAIFPSPDGAVCCARSISQDVQRLGLSSRTGVHSGPYQTGGEKVSGINVHVAARVMAAARPGEVMLSEAVCNSLDSYGSGLSTAAAHALKGLPGEWPLYRAA
jgi:class 3 adenylate cyclase